MMETLTLISPRTSALLLTFLSYAAFHASRKPPSVAKSVLSSWGQPFSGPRGSHRLGELDLAFLASYSLSMTFLSGPIADRRNPRSLLLLSSLASAAASLALSLAFFLPIHSLTFFLVVQFVSGIFQAFAWPCVVAVVGNWFGNSDKKGLIMGIWNSHTSVGNILGSVLAASVLEFGWGWSFVLPAVLLAAVGILVYAFLVVSPREIGLEAMEVEISSGDGEEEEKEDAGLLGEGLVAPVEKRERAIGFLDAWRLPGVAPFAFCLFFSKLVAYTFLYWLPFYIRHTGMINFIYVINAAFVECLEKFY